MAVGNIYLIAAISIIGGGLFGFDISSMSAIIGTQQYKCYFDQSGDGSCSGPRASVQGGITASMAGGSWLGALISGFISDRIGRKKAILIGAVVWWIGSIIVGASQDIAMLIVGRVINGLSVGICSPAWKTRVDRKRTLEVERHGSLADADRKISDSSATQVEARDSDDVHEKV